MNLVFQTVLGPKVEVHRTANKSEIIDCEMFSLFKYINLRSLELFKVTSYFFYFLEETDDNIRQCVPEEL